MVVFERDTAIDMGSSGTLFYVQNDGIILREPSVVAVDKASGQMLKCGEDARRMLGRTPANITAIYPLTAGVISDYDMAALMLKDFVGRCTTNSLCKPRALICVPSSISGVEDVEAFDEETVALSTAGGGLTIHGSGLKINKLTLDGGELLVEGRIDGLEYASERERRRGFLGKLMG